MEEHTLIFKKCRFLEFFQKTLKTYLFHQEAFSLFINRFLFNFHTYIYRFFRVLVHCKAPRTVNDMVACVQTSPHPQKKSGEDIFSVGGGTSVHRL